ncbi:hypothetical protein [Microbacterium lacticum]
MTWSFCSRLVSVIRCIASLRRCSTSDECTVRALSSVPRNDVTRAST